jgi:hypothetical protein
MGKEKDSKDIEILSDDDKAHKKSKKSKPAPESESESSDSESSESESERSIGADSEVSLTTSEILSSDPLYTILSQFFMTKDGTKSLVDVLEEINQKLSIKQSHKKTK